MENEIKELESKKDVPLVEGVDKKYDGAILTAIFCLSYAGIICMIILPLFSGTAYMIAAAILTLIPLFSVPGVFKRISNIEKKQNEENND